MNNWIYQINFQTLTFAYMETFTYLCLIKLQVMDKLTRKQKLIVVGISTLMGLAVVFTHYFSNH
jgi:hypothetical protein